MRRFFLFVLILSFLLPALSWLGLEHYAKSPGSLARDTVILIEPGDGFKAITRTLSDAGVIRHPLLFQAWVLAHQKHRAFKAGEFLINRRSAPKDVVHLLVYGKSIEHAVTIPEGKISREILAILKEAPLLKGDVPARIAEGSLLPETYHFLRGTQRSEILSRMERAQRSLLEAAWAKRDPDLPLRSMKEALILASIVEKETGKPEERPRVAAVFINRLRKGMRLQSDPTTLYGIYAASGVMKSSLTTADLREKTAYNTYEIDGLPPGPICHPGRHAIEAVMHPPVTQELYFVADGTGGHAFAATLEEHNSNVARYRALLREQR